MKLPWTKKIEQKQKRIEELEDRIQTLEEQKRSVENRFESEKNRRSELAAEKQEAEEELNRLRDRIDQIEQQKDSVSEVENKTESASELEFDESYRLLKKLESMESPEEDMVTLYSPGKVSGVEDFKGLKNTVSRDQLEFLSGRKSILAFLDSDLPSLVLKTRPFFDSCWHLDHGFKVEPVLDFIEEEKVFVLVSAGETRIFREESGDFELLERVKSRVDREHGKGGFSQDRFERKRDEQIDQHLEQVEEKLQDWENIYLLGQKTLCKELPGEHLGGFDPNATMPEVFYSFQLITET